MLKKTISYTDFNGEDVQEDYYFHLSKAELVELELSHSGGLSEALKRIVAAEDGKQIIAEFKNIILGSYGQRSEDGKRFVKNQQLRDEFESTEAYSALFMELVMDADAAAEFVNGVIPKDMAAEVAKLAPEPGPQLAAAADPEPPVTIKRAVLDTMSQEEIMKMGARISAGEVVIAE